jgi:hypothetical protein
MKKKLPPMILIFFFKKNQAQVLKLNKKLLKKPKLNRLTHTWINPWKEKQKNHKVQISII